VRTFHAHSGKLFHVYSVEEMALRLDHLFQANHDAVPRKLLCEVCCVAAAGTLFSTELFRSQNPLYELAQVLLQETIEQSPLEAAKCCMLLGLYNIVNKALATFSYLEMGMDLCRRHGFHNTYAAKPQNLSIEDWLDGRKTWRSILFLGSWVSSTLGYIPRRGWIDDESTFRDVGLPNDAANVIDAVQTELVRISLLKQEILRINVPDGRQPALAADAVRKDLHEWHRTLPEAMSMANLVNHPSMPVDARISIYMLHLLYLGALIMIYRQILNSSKSFTEIKSADLERAHVDAIMAAQQSSRILHLLLEVGGVNQRCWISIYQSYSASVIILHGIAQDLTQPVEQRLLRREDLEQAERCMDILKYCAEADPVAGQLYGIIKPYYEMLNVVATTPRSSPDLILQAVCADLFNLVRRPFRGLKDLTEPPSTFAEDNNPSRRPSHPLDSLTVDGDRASTVDGGRFSKSPSYSQVTGFIDSARPHGWFRHVQ